MEGIRYYRLKDHPDFPKEIDVPFLSQLRLELLCSACDAITPMGIKDGKHHAFCRNCANVQTDSDNKFTCAVCYWHGDRSSMRKNTEEWAILENTKASCPNQKAKCSFNGSLKEVLIHYIRCNCTGMAPCGLCGESVNRKIHGPHIVNECPNRIVQCIFCNDDFEAWAVTEHESACPQRPGTCEHCGKRFRSHFLLEKEHYPRCPRMPVFCLYKDLGCEYEAPRCGMAEHTSDGSHNQLLIEAICSQQGEIKEFKKENATLKEKMCGLEKDVQELKNDYAVLKQMVHKLEDCTNTNEYIRANMAEDLEDLRKQISELRAAALQKKS